MTTKGYVNDFYKQFEELNKKLDKANSTIFNMSLTISELNENNKKLTKELEKANKKVQELLLEIERLKNNNDKDSSNSSKPSSTNGYKKVITNNREKSGKKQGGQVGHKGETLTKEKIDKMIENKEIDRIIIVEENKNKLTENNTPIVTYEIDIKVEKVLIKHVYYPTTPQNITSSPVIYGNNIKSISALMYMKGSSLDAIKSLLGEFTDNKLIPSKGSIYSWIHGLSDVLSNTEYENFKNRYLEILKEGNLKYKKDLKTNSYKKDERRLLNRLEKYVDNHLLFLKKFYVPFSNNRAEADLRFVKIRQKIGKFRSIESE